jgi:DNA-binding MarR family transcriptional regulator
MECESLTDRDYAALLELRTTLRRFLRWSERKAREAGLTPMQHQLLLAVRGHLGPTAPAVGDLADYLLLRHHSAVELVDRAADARLVVRQRDPEDHRVVRVALTRLGASKLRALSAEHQEELRRFAKMFRRISTALP